MKKLTFAAAVTAVTLAAGLAPAAATQPVALTLPGPTGPYPVGTKELHLVDHDRIDPWTSRPRELMVSLWYPAAGNGPRARQFPPAVAAYYDRNAGVPPGTADFAGTLTRSRTGATPLPGRRPVVLYSPGGGHSRFLGTTLVEDLASRGYVVVGIDHTPVGPVQFPDRVELPRSGVDAAQVLRERVRDTSFVLDELAAFPTLDLTRVGMFGHSMGGFTTAEAMIGENRIKAGANLDGSMDPRYGQAASVGVTRPFLLMGGGLSSGAPHNHAHSGDWASFWSTSTGWRRDVYLPTAEHLSFSDAQVLLPQLDGDFTASIGTIDPRSSLAAQRKYLGAFFNLHLRGWPTTAFDRPTHPDVQLIP
ncbi:alpha/beta hydrolase [Saccharothrix sp. NPDC042600]|uniref:alpha/beta hydrolase family protein n=1 Tax=Saccharothrix TaxID=2071 RepID=UPI00340DA83B|nr:lipase [Saccharothrix mutabilis subsp. capreolus]